VLVLTGYGQQLVSSGTIPKGVPVFDNLAAVADDLLENK